MAKAEVVVYEKNKDDKEGEQQSAASAAVEAVMGALGESRRWALWREVGTCVGAVVARLWREFAERGALEALPLEAMEAALKEGAGAFAVGGRGDRERAPRWRPRVAPSSPPRRPRAARSLASFTPSPPTLSHASSRHPRSRPRSRRGILPSLVSKAALLNVLKL